MSEREARAMRAQIKRVSEGGGIKITNRQTIESGAHGSRTEETPESPHTMPAIPDPQGDSIFEGDFGVDVSYDIAFLVSQSDLPPNMTDAGSEELSSRVEYMGETYRLETVNTRFPAELAILGCTAGDEV